MILALLWAVAVAMAIARALSCANAMSAAMATAIAMTHVHFRPTDRPTVDKVRGPKSVVQSLWSKFCGPKSRNALSCFVFFSYENYKFIYESLRFLRPENRKGVFSGELETKTCC